MADGERIESVDARGLVLDGVQYVALDDVVAAMRVTATNYRAAGMPALATALDKIADETAFAGIAMQTTGVGRLKRYRTRGKRVEED